jgi:hypothetical protein
MDATSPATQLIDGWYVLEDDFRWTKPDAIAILLKRPDLHNFQVEGCVLPEQIQKSRAVLLRVLLNTQLLGQHEFTAPGCQAVQWPAPPLPAGKVTIEFRLAPPYPAPKPDPRIFGIAMKGFGFIP